jgi:hypothetical protein
VNRMTSGPGGARNAAKPVPTLSKLGLRVGMVIHLNDAAGFLGLVFKARMVCEQIELFWSTDGDSNSGLRICSPAHSHSDIRAVFSPSDTTYFNAPSQQRTIRQRCV